MLNRTTMRQLAALVLVPVFACGSAVAQTNSAAEASATKPSRLFGDVQATDRLADDDQPAQGKERTGQSGQDANRSERESVLRGDPGTASGPGRALAGEGIAAGSTGFVTPMAADDQEMLQSLALANLAEVRAAQQALDKSRDTEVRGFARLMLDDHNAALQKLRNLAQAKGMSLAENLSEQDIALTNQLEKLAGDNFDRTYLSRAGVSGHQKVRDLLEKIQAEATDVDLKSLARDLQPVIDQHLYTARHMHGEPTSRGGGADGGTKAGK